MTLAHRGAGAAIQLPGSAPPPDSDTCDPCVVCGLPPTGGELPLLCAGCRERPFSTQESLQSHLDLFGPTCPPYPAALLQFLSWEGAVTVKRTRHQVGVAALWVPTHGTHRVSTTEGVCKTTTHLTCVPWREVVLFPGRRMWLETRWSVAKQEHIPAMYAFRFDHYDEDDALAKKGWALLKLRRERGNPNLQQASPEVRARRLKLGADAHARLMRDPRLSHERLAKELRVTRATLRRRLADYYEEEKRRL